MKVKNVLNVLAFLSVVCLYSCMEKPTQIDSSESMLSESIIESDETDMRILSEVEQKVEEVEVLQKAPEQSKFVFYKSLAAFKAVNEMYKSDRFTFDQHPVIDFRYLGDPGNNKESLRLRYQKEVVQAYQLQGYEQNFDKVRRMTISDDFGTWSVIMSLDGSPGAILDIVSSYDDRKLMVYPKDNLSVEEIESMDNQMLENLLKIGEIMRPGFRESFKKKLQ